MSEDHSVSKFIEPLKSGDADAASFIWLRYYPLLLKFAQKRLMSCSRRILDEDDVLQVVFENFFRQVQEGRFQVLNNREDLWQILSMLVDRKAKDQVRKLNTQKQGKGKVHGDSINIRVEDEPVLNRAADDALTGDQALEFTEQIEKRLNQLDTKEDQKIVLLKMACYGNQEIAQQLGMALRTVERKLANIRKAWEGADRSAESNS